MGLKSNQGLIQFGTWENGDAIYPNGELGRGVIRNIKWQRKQKSSTLDVSSFFMPLPGLWETATREMKSSCRWQKI